MFYSILFIFGIIFTVLGLFVIFASTIGFIRNEDFFIKVQAVSISNLYGVTFFLLGESMKNFNFKSFLLTLIIIIVNIVSSLVVIHSITRFAFIENIKTNATNRRNLKKS